MKHLLPARLLGVFKFCPKTGKVVGLNTKHRFAWLVVPLLGVPALVWYLIRVIPKPDRATYPCMQFAGPVAASAVAYTLKIGLIVAITQFFRKRVGPRLEMVVLLLSGFVLLLAVGTHFVLAVATGTYQEQAANAPIGTGQGIHPGRVAWAHDPDSVLYDGTGNWYDDDSIDQARVDAMMQGCVLAVAGETDLGSAWEALFESSNVNRGRGSGGYQSGEKIVIKINLNNRGGTNNRVDTSPQVTLSLLKQLVRDAGVAESDITVYEAQHNGGMPLIQGYCLLFPSVNYVDAEAVTWVADAIAYSAEITNSNARRMPDFVVAADYMINAACLKRHCKTGDDWTGGYGQTGVTLCAKNHWGTIGSPSALHESIRDWHPDRGMGSYNPCVDVIGSRYLGGKTVLYVIDGLFGSKQYGGKPFLWQMAPFNNNYPGSVFASQDPVAIDSVGLDFLRTEMDLVANADNYLHEAALADSPPSGTAYQPDGVPLPSLGAHEHWNNATDKQYSRDLGFGTGIELHRVVIPVAPNPWSSSDVGAVNIPGSVVFDGKTEEYLMEATGADIWNTADGFHFQCQEFYGDGELIVRIGELEGPHNWTKAGLMIRETLDDDSRHCFATVTRAQGISLHWRSSAGGTTSTHNLGAGAAPVWLKLQRKGDTFYGYHSGNGSDWTAIHQVELPLAKDCFAGVALTSHDNDVAAQCRYGVPACCDIFFEPRIDRDGDTLDRFFEYAFCGDFENRDAGREVKVRRPLAATEISHYRRTDDPGLGYVLETSENLIDWDSAPAEWEQIDSVPHPEVAGEEVTLRKTGAPSNSREFYRLRIQVE